MKLKHIIPALFISALFAPLFGHAAGTLQPVGSAYAPMVIEDHAVNVVINNGFAMTRVTQTFRNPNTVDLEALYTFPLPQSATLSEVTVTIGETVINGEVLAKEEAEKIYGEERDAGNDAALAEKDGYKHLTFAVSRVPAGNTALVSFLYYQPLAIDTGVGRYVYPLAEGGTDDSQEMSFWQRNDTVSGIFSFAIELKSAWPVSDVRLPGLESQTTIDQPSPNHYRARVERTGSDLSKDIIFYYRLQDNLPGRVELIPYRADTTGAGTFMLVVTPGLDLRPLDQGADYIFILDTSGSMSAKIGALAQGVSRALDTLRPEDRFRIVSFNNAAQSLYHGWQTATPANVKAAIQKVSGLGSSGGTNLYAGLKEGLRSLDDDRATSIILVTDGVTNQGVISPKAFHELMKEHDIRVFGFLMGNSANWPLMRTICDASGGFYDSVSTGDDILGKIMLAKSKMGHACLHDAELTITGGGVSGLTDGMIGKVFRGQQLVFFGRYATPGPAEVTLKATLTGEDKVYSTTFDFPAVDTANPELERLWAMNQVEHIEQLAMVGATPADEAATAVRDLGVEYQIVTDETSMLVLSDETFRQHGIERRNQARTGAERAAQARRAAQPPANRRVDNHKPAFDLPTPSIGGGAGAIDPFMALVLGTLSSITLIIAKHTRKQ
ncbi:MAG: VIT and VWA domain-containing protein [Lentisphaeria bacterium]|nr:VIT and VWA domain-containing protein [Lentisphaeria bacterium]